MFMAPLMCQLNIRISPELLELAGREAERQGYVGLGPTALIRLALARLAGVDVVDYTPKVGRPALARTRGAAGDDRVLVGS